MKTMRYWMLPIIVMLLSGCAAAVIMSAAGGLVVYDRRSVPMIERDARIYYQANRMLTSDARFRGSHIVVASFNQMVLLLGQTPASSLREMAAQLVKSIPNVLRVYNEITIDEPISLDRQGEDVWITGQVRAALLAEKGLDSGSIRVVTENAIVYLMGIATAEQSEFAVRAAREVNGVRKVVKVFNYIH